MTQQQPGAPDALVQALRSAMAGRPAGILPGQLRVEIEAALGPEQAAAMRRQVHQVVAAAEDHLPVRLVRVSPLTPVALARFRDELAASRGWSTQTAERTTRIWVDALGYTELAVASWPAQAPAPARPPAPVRPAVPELTALPPRERALRAEPGSARTLPVLVTLVAGILLLLAGLAPVLPLALRVLSIVAAIAAGALLVRLVGYGVGRDPR